MQHRKNGTRKSADGYSATRRKCNMKRAQYEKKQHENSMIKKRNAKKVQHGISVT